MPIYEYRCRDCHQIFEEWCRHIEEDSVAHSCPICSGEAKRLVSHTSFTLKGGGWYVTEYGSRKNTTEAGMATPAESAAPAGKEGTCLPKKESAATTPATTAPAVAH